MVVGLVKATAHIGLGEDSLREVEFLVDTGSLFTFLPREIADDLGITFPVTSRVITADSRAIEALVGVAYLRLMDREGGIIVASMPDGLDVPLPLLGATALQTLGLKVNPVDETLEYYLPFGPALL
jgi:predicted aspartyl protease